MKILNFKQRSPEWYDARRGVITGTKLKGLMGRTKQEHIYRLVAERITVEDIYENMMERGARLEPEAIEFFQQLTGKTVEEVGFVVGEDGQGLSPDGLIKNNGKYTEALEVKCLSGYKHVQAIFEKEIPKEYYPQVLQYFNVLPDLELLNFVFYHDGCPEKYKMVIVPVTREDVEADVIEARQLQDDVKKEVDDLVSKLIM